MLRPPIRSPVGSHCCEKGGSDDDRKGGELQGCLDPMAIDIVRAALRFTNLGIDLSDHGMVAETVHRDQFFKVKESEAGPGRLGSLTNHHEHERRMVLI